MWYFKIVGNESDPSLSAQLQQFRSQGGFELTCFYKHCHNYITQIATYVDVDLFSLPASQRKDKVREAMFKELNVYWLLLGEAQVTRRIHPSWERYRLSSFMHTRYSHTLMHNLALGRGPLRRTVHRHNDLSLQKCRYGCDQIEDLEHVVFNCKRLNESRTYLKKRCQEEDMKYEMRTLFCEAAVQIETEKMLLEFFTVKQSQ